MSGRYNNNNFGNNTTQGGAHYQRATSYGLNRNFSQQQQQHQSSGQSAMVEIKEQVETPRTPVRVNNASSFRPFNPNTTARTPGTMNRSIFGFQLTTPGGQQQPVASRSNSTFYSNALNGSTYTVATNNNLEELPKLYETIEGLIEPLMADNDLVYRLSENQRPQEMFELYKAVFNVIPELKLDLALNINNNSAAAERNVKLINRQLAAIGLQEGGHHVNLTVSSVKTARFTPASLQRWLEVLVRVLREVVVPVRQVVAEHKDRMSSKVENSRFLVEQDINIESLQGRPSKATFMHYLQMEKEQKGSYLGALNEQMKKQLDQTHQKTLQLEDQKTRLQEEIRQLKVSFLCLHFKNCQFTFSPFQASIAQEDAQDVALEEKEKELDRETEAILKAQMLLVDDILEKKMMEDEDYIAMKKTVEGWIAQVEEGRTTADHEDLPQYDAELDRLRGLLKLIETNPAKNSEKIGAAYKEEIERMQARKAKIASLDKQIKDELELQKVCEELTELTGGLSVPEKMAQLKEEREQIQARGKRRARGKGKGKGKSNKSKK